MTLVRRYFVCAVLCAVLRSSGTQAELVVCGRAVMRDARPWLFIFAVLSAVLRSGFRDTGKLRGASVRGGKVRGTVRGFTARRWVMCEAQQTAQRCMLGGAVLGFELGV